MTGLHARGERLLIVGGHDDCEDVAHADTYPAKRLSEGCATVQGSSWKCKQ